ncbi:unnamed protein product [Rotaria sordida]|uniref:Uncharacterized protein n=1 Tax=Rotaria sordida TaxID=392033 RepID=A0A814LAS2_9BILA|nr:unnamed protein product [Rotaria sordida]CAF1052861.1 unnamed protein product [Rotaria sordida]CAF1061438.1 unnamed protein product [Rotaria sordida]CAF1062531.1 unnamed protein product [Rotaria sordida]CAF3880767.1 unnamed protein product [Rotaria sordida]
MSNTDNSKTTSTTTENKLDDLVSQLRQTINKSDWLIHNTSAKWEQENPDLAKQWREAIKINQPNDSTEQ